MNWTTFLDETEKRGWSVGHEWNITKLAHVIAAWCPELPELPDSPRMKCISLVVLQHGDVPSAFDEMVRRIDEDEWELFIAGQDDLEPDLWPPEKP